ncbi:GAG-binding domain-containing protein [Erysipelothrix rhusiopathiae]|nr:GAG-binding domain-containing protein [Erysipelothrix rhusiopathiae]MDE8042768.1 GAG-binding domain-containing protein [Erysipelothrix rhusiopathiae]MDE8049635.1 GAG-binding domain-containing protein [Erysipelothrix rhusiopathiae]MDE8058996.1 GAG-binding domain-containing protein [Erysipelothrix rhusiopathiae]MDE8066140.1 GAG-binding domain-containing protein [Erysipelothrix rhusiopathiae]
MVRNRTQSIKRLKWMLTLCISFGVVITKPMQIGAEVDNVEASNHDHKVEYDAERALILFKGYLFSFDNMTAERANKYIELIKRLPVEAQAAKIDEYKKVFEARRQKEKREQAVETLLEELDLKFFYIPDGVKANYAERIRSSSIEELPVIREELLSIDTENSKMVDVYRDLRDKLLTFEFLSISDKHYYDDRMENAFYEKNELMLRQAFNEAVKVNEAARLTAPSTLLENAKADAMAKVTQLYKMMDTIEHRLEPLPKTKFYQKYEAYWTEFKKIRKPKEAVVEEIKALKSIAEVDAYTKRYLMPANDFLVLEYSARAAFQIAKQYPTHKEIQEYLSEDIFKTWPKGDVNGLSFVAMKRLSRIENAVESINVQPEQSGVQKPDKSIKRNAWLGAVGRSKYVDETGNFLRSQWKQVQGNMYYFNQTGIPNVGLFTVGNQKYYSTEKGVSEQWHRYGKTWYYTDQVGRVVTGWKKISGKWYYLDESGEMAIGWKKINHKWYYLDGSGAMVTGWKKLNQKWYYLNQSGVMVTGWKKINHKWYYLEGSGVMAIGWKKIGNEWYYLDETGAMVTGWKHINKKWYYLDDSGTMIRGWRKLNGIWYRFDQTGAMF